MDEFALIDAVVEVLGDRAGGDWIAVGPGDDAAVIDVSPGHQLVASIDALIAGVHFPADAPARLIGYRALMVSLSDVAAMAATPRYVLVSLTLPEPDVSWCRELALGMRDAAQAADVYLCGGNFSRGELAIHVSAHGEISAGEALTRSGAQPGDGVFVSGELGGAAACVRQRDFDFAEPLRPQQFRYMCPQARFDLAPALRGDASAAIDVSDGLAQDLAHISRASGVRVDITADSVPVHPDATLEDALYGGDDYEIACTGPRAPEGFVRIGEVSAGGGVWIDGARFEQRGYNHFSA